MISPVGLLATPWTSAGQASLSITNSQSLLKLMSIESVMPSNHLILCRSLLLLPSIFPSVRVFSKESALRIRWPKYWSFSFNISPSNKHPGLFAFRMDWLISLQSKGLSGVSSGPEGGSGAITQPEMGSVFSLHPASPSPLPPLGSAALTHFSAAAQRGSSRALLGANFHEPVSTHPR